MLLSPEVFQIVDEYFFFPYSYYVFFAGGLLL